MPAKAGTCFVPGCKSGYKSCPARVSSFRTPKDALKREQWARNIKRGDKELTNDCVVCERHFEATFIQRTCSHLINGEVVEIPTEDAVPTIIPDAPKYLTKKTPTSRKETNLCEQGEPTTKERTTVKQQAPEESEQVIEAQHAAESEFTEAVHIDTTQVEPQIEVSTEYVCRNIELPSTSWNKLSFSTEPGTVTFGLCEIEGAELDHLLLPKLVKFEQAVEQVGTVSCSVFLRGKLHLKCNVSPPDDAQLALNSAQSLVLCAGCGMKPNTVGKYEYFASLYISPKCSLACGSKGPCMHCKYLRKLLQNQQSRWKHGVSVKRLARHANSRRRLVAAQRKLLNVQRELDMMKSANEQIGDEALNERVKSLPQKQQMAIMACFSAAKRKSTCGMLYEKNWILECVLLRMRSPKLHEHLWKQKIVVLPSRTCLQRYVRNFKSGFGFNDTVFKALSAKTESMDVCSRHGGIIFDELKLSEQFGVNQADV
ncbi:uncharacterized protein LOC125758823 [Rhipicephalus sanguineus]|uniref:uncharacterized protein LOC125758823 n=1 Tax=Rhipicephalus sanguineus TaxID=34632 RepID=UPI0020C3142D|nr:uncharacterized protein LOC125758823 [Rhipicephalus sanguineus]